MYVCVRNPEVRDCDEFHHRLWWWTIIASAELRILTRRVLCAQTMAWRLPTASSTATFATFTTNRRPWGPNSILRLLPTRKTQDEILHMRARVVALEAMVANLTISE